MSPRAKQQTDFARALLQPSFPVPETVVSPTGGKVARRFNIYRNNVVASLIEALARNYPAIERLVGEAYFRALARAFVEEHPPRSPVMLDYGDAFASFLETFPPLAVYPYMPDVARLEWAWLRAFHAGDVEALTPESLGALPAEELAGAVFEKHPATGLIMSRYPVFSIFRSNRLDDRVAGESPAGGENALVTRPGLDVDVRMLPGGAAAFVRALCEGRTLGEAALTGAGFEGFDLTENIQGILDVGAFCSVALPECAKH